MSENNGRMSEMTSLGNRPDHSINPGDLNGTLSDNIDMEPKPKTIQELQEEISAYENLITSLKSGEMADGLNESEEKLLALKNELNSRMGAE